MRNLTITFFAVAIFATANSHWAAAQQVGEPLVVEPPTLATAGELISENRHALLSQRIRAARFVKIATSTPVRVRYGLGAERKIELPAGTVLHQASLDGHVYCTTFPLLGSAACLEDTKGGGVFDGALTAKPDNMAGDYVGFTEDGQALRGVFFGAPYPLETPVAYEEISETQGPSSTIAVHWVRDWGSIKPGKPVTIYIWTSLSGGRIGVDGYRSSSLEVKVDQQSGAIAEIGGARFQFLGFTDDGSVRYRILQPLPSGPQRFSLF